MLSEGRILAERYEITGKIGTGGMSDVYKAKDHKLNRFVAIKVLKSEFSENRNFVSKFRVEAQSAAILMHPNIVNVYDVGEEDGLHYIVMELVEGITLKKYIEKKLRVAVKESISIAIQVAQGIESAHNNHIIHRDIKPQNIIISKEGKVKVTDFGIARAATSNTITSNAMGSVHYTSPEQARGGYSDEKSDIYSLGITMFEMLTGRVPFDGETTVQIAIKHIQQELPSPREYVDDIPVSVEQIIFKCCQKNAARRYQNMGELIADLKKSLLTPDENFVTVVDLESQGKTRTVTPDDIRDIRNQTGSIDPLDEELISAGRPMKINAGNRGFTEEFGIDSADVGYDDAGYADEYDTEYAEGYEDEYADEYADEYGDDVYAGGYDEGYDEYGDDVYEEYPSSRVRTAGSSGKNSGRGTGRNTGKNTGKGGRKNNQGRSKNDTKTPARPPKNTGRKPNTKKRSRGFEDEEDDDIDPRMEKVMGVLGVLAAVIIAAIAIVVVSKMFGVFKSTTGDLGKKTEVSESVRMIAVTGKNYDVAKGELKALGLSVEATYVSSATVEKDQVISQSIEDGEVIPVGSVVELEVSSGTDGVAVPNVTGLTEAEAKVNLENSGFTMAKEEGASDSIAKGNVISQNPNYGESIPKGSTVTVIISTGASETAVEVPDIRLQTETDAKAMLTAQNLSWSTVSEEFSDTVPIGCVVNQSYAPGTSVPEGTSVSFTLSAGPQNGGNALYKCNFLVNAPSAYTGGNAVVTLTQPDTGAVLFATTTTAFPVTINLANISGSPNALISVTYTVIGNVVTEQEDGTTISTPTADEKTEYQQVTLTPEG